MKALCVFLFGATACQRLLGAPDADVTTTTTTATAASVTASAAVVPIANGKTYAIHMRRPSRVGDRGHLIADDEHIEKTSALLSGETARKDSKKSAHVHLDGTVVMLELQTDGHSALRDEVTVNEFWQTHDDGSTETLAPAGARILVVRAAKKEDARVTLDGKPATKSFREAVDHLTTLTLHKGPSDDEIFGTSAPQAVGAEWPINGALAEKDLIERGIDIPANGVSGKTKLAGAPTVNGIDCLDLQSKITVASLKSIKELPPGSTITNGSIEVGFHMLLPIDETRTPPQSDMDITMKGTFSVPSPKGPVEVILDSVDHKRISLTPAK